MNLWIRVHPKSFCCCFLKGLSQINSGARTASTQIAVFTRRTGSGSNL